MGGGRFHLVNVSGRLSGQVGKNTLQAWLCEVRHTTFRNMIFGINVTLSGIEFKDFNLGFGQCTFLCTTLNVLESGIPSVKFRILGTWNPLKFTA